MGGRGRRPRREVEPWELDLLHKIARRFRTSAPEDLEAELARKLLVLKAHLPSGIRDWASYLAKFFYNKASNWVRDERARQRRLIEVPDLTQYDVAPDQVLFHVQPSEDLGELMEALRKRDPVLQTLCEVLIQESGNQVRAARRLGVHRNTIRHWLRKLKCALIDYGL